jgi:hypothetical protein
MSEGERNPRSAEAQGCFFASLLPAPVMPRSDAYRNCRFHRRRFRGFGAYYRMPTPGLSSRFVSIVARYMVGII